MNYYNEIKNELIKNEINKRVKDYSKNKYELERYYNIGKLLNDAGKHYGEGIIKKYSIQLTNELNKSYNTTKLKRIRKFYQLIEKGATLWHQLSWSHYRILITLNDIDEINYYGMVSVNNCYSVRQLEKIINSNEYKRLPENTKNKLIKEHSTKIKDFIKNPIIIKNNNNYEIISEKVLQSLILEDIESFMNELGNSFSFIGSEYKIKLGNTYNYIDLLLFNIEYNCYVIIELKVTELKKEHIGQIQIYMNYIDEHKRKIYQSKTVGIIIVKEDNEFIMKYCSDNRILRTTFKVIK